MIDQRDERLKVFEDGEMIRRADELEDGEVSLGRNIGLFYTRRPSYQTSTKNPLEISLPGGLRTLMPMQMGSCSAACSWSHKAGQRRQ